MPIKHTIRADCFGKTEDVTIGPAKAIRLFCRECYGFEKNWQQMVEECPSPMCPLYPFRLGRDPSRAGVVRNPQGRGLRTAETRNMTTSHPNQGLGTP